MTTPGNEWCCDCCKRWDFEHRRWGLHHHEAPCYDCNED